MGDQRGISRKESYSVGKGGTVRKGLDKSKRIKELNAHAPGWSKSQWRETDKSKGRRFRGNNDARLASGV